MVRPEEWDERIEMGMARIISSLLDVVTEPHSVTSELYRQVDRAGGTTRTACSSVLFGLAQRDWVFSKRDRRRTRQICAGRGGRSVGPGSRAAPGGGNGGHSVGGRAGDKILDDDT